MCETVRNGFRKNQLLNIKVFDGNGFSTCEYRVKLMLKRRDVLSLIDQDPPTDATALTLFKKLDIQARNTIVQCLDDKILEMVKDSKTAKEMLNVLRSTYIITGMAN